MIYVAIGIDLVVLAINIAATVRAIRSSIFTPRQKTLQVIVIWLVPILGGLACLYFQAEPAGTKVDYRSAETTCEDTWLVSGSESHRD